MRRWNKHDQQDRKSLLHRALDGQLPFNHLPPHTPLEESQLYAEHGPLWERSYALEDDEDIICTQSIKLSNTSRYLIGLWGPLTALEINYNLVPLDSNSTTTTTTTWKEIESVVALEELKPRKTWLVLIDSLI
ncbi:hypothetical protein H4Q26_003395 [Puccinia striiformis f. sp. tritici PST-130]|nr:hypothetical protein H4Q26_003395 [Puccinia striiformis f. sp. tritici PST-130]